MKAMLQLLVICLCFLKKSEASIVSLEAYPQEIKENLTESVSLICKVVNNIVQSRASSSATDVRHISSIFVSRGGDDDVASVTAFDPPTALADLDNLQVKGSVSALSGEGSLELTWKDATSMKMGDYLCTVGAVDNKGHNVVLTSHIAMTSVAPSMLELILDLKSKTSKTEEQHQQDITKLQQDNTKLQQDNTHLHQYITNIQQDNNQLQVKLDKCNPEISFQARLSSSNVVIGGHPIVYDVTMLNDGNGYNNSTGTFTCSIAGTYLFNVQAQSASSVSTTVFLRLYLNSDIMSGMWAGHNAGTYASASMSAVMRLEAGDVVKVVPRPDSTLHNAYGESNVFNGHIIHADGC